MDNSLVVGAFEGRTHLQGILDDQFPGQAFFRLEDVVQRAPGDQLHRVESLLVFADASKAANNVRVPERLENLHLTLKAGQRGRIGDVRRQHLQRHLDFARYVAGPVDLPHSAFADLVQQLKRPDPAGRTR